MKNRSPLALVLAALCALVLSGCLLPMDPVCSELRRVQVVSDAAKTLTVVDGMMFGNPMMNRGIRFPGGVYTLEAEDADYWYFRAPAALEFRNLERGQPVSGQDLPGGLMLAKTFSMVPGAAYVDSAEPGMKVKSWNLGSEFLGVEGRRWYTSFKR